MKGVKKICEVCFFLMEDCICREHAMRTQKRKRSQDWQDLLEMYPDDIKVSLCRSYANYLSKKIKARAAISLEYAYLEAGSDGAQYQSDDDEEESIELYHGYNGHPYTCRCQMCIKSAEDEVKAEAKTITTDCRTELESALNK